MPEKREYTAKELFKEAGGKDLKKDRQKTAKVVVESMKEYKKIGAKRSDLSGLDTRKSVFVDTRVIRRPVVRRMTRINLRSEYLEEFEERVPELYGYMASGTDRGELGRVQNRAQFGAVMRKSLNRDRSLAHLNKVAPELEEVLWRYHLQMSMRYVNRRY